MSLGDELYARVVAAPDEDAPRIAYADWLTAQGDPRGEYIQCEVALARRPPAHERDDVDRRAKALLAAHETAWAAPFVAADTVVAFARGLPHRVSGSGRALLAASAWLAQHPIRELAISRAEPPEAEGLARMPLLAQLDALELRGVLGDEGFATLVGAPRLRLRRLEAVHHDLGARALTALAAAPWLAGLEELALIESRLDASGLAALAPGLGTVTKLSLYHCPLGDAGAVALATGTYDALVELVLDGTGIGDAGGAALGAARLDRAESVRLADNELGWKTARALARNPHLGRLARLDLTHNRLDDAGAAELAHSPRLPALVELKLASNAFGEVGATAFAIAPERRGLATLDLGGCRMGDAGASALASSQTLAALQRLDVTDCKLEVSGTIAFVERTGLPALRELAISNNGILTTTYEEYTDWAGTVVGGANRPEDVFAIRARFAARWPDLHVV